jgi:polar amino acid transport system substrate-binding protein
MNDMRFCAGKRSAGAALIVLASGLAILPAGAQDPAPIKRNVASDVKSLPGVSLDEKIRAMLPSEIRDVETLSVATTAFVPPIAFFGSNNQEIIGISPDLITAFGIIFGVKMEMMDLGMDSAVVPSIQSKRFDMSASGAFDSLEREKVVDILDYMFDGQTILVPKGNPKSIKTLDDFCGKTIAVGVGTIQERTVSEKDEKCAESINVLRIPKQPEVLAAVRSGRADATLNGYATSIYSTQNQIGAGQGLEAVAEIRVNVGYVGMLFNKSNTQLRDAAQAALQKLIESGAYATIMEKWGVAPLAVKAARINDAGNLPRND